MQQEIITVASCIDYASSENITVSFIRSQPWWRWTGMTSFANNNNNNTTLRPSEDSIRSCFHRIGHEVAPPLLGPIRGLVTFGQPPVLAPFISKLILLHHLYTHTHDNPLQN
jgi:hypothetical protein